MKHHTKVEHCALKENLAHHGENIAASKGILALIELAIQEDVYPEDVTSTALISPEVKGRAFIVSRGNYRVCGNWMVKKVVQKMNAATILDIHVEDGQDVSAGGRVLSMEGSLQRLLSAERIALNFMQRMTGIATMAREYVDAVSDYPVEILDTRKTTPGMRSLEKYAVLCGGGTNHRMGLYDRVMIKDNHVLDWTKGQKNPLAEAVMIAREKNPGLLIEAEADTVEQVKELLESRPDWILLDNMTLDEMRECVKFCRGLCKTEASGGVTLERIAEIAATGVDAISVGALTHSVPAADLSLELY